MTNVESERFWRRRATLLAWKWNAGWWLERFNPLAISGLIVFSIVIIGVRTYRETMPSPIWAGGSLFFLLMILALAGWFLGRSHFITEREGLVRLDERLRLNNRLTSAREKVGAWPDYTARDWAKADYRWNPLRAWFPGLAALALVFAAWYVPVPEREAADPALIVEPAAWEQMEDWLTRLEEEQLLEEKAIEELSGKIEELRNQPEEEWFSHSSLEATDTLMDSIGQELRDLAGDMAALERNLSALQASSGTMGEATRQKRIREYEEALEALAGNGLGMNEELLKQLQEIDPSALGQETLGNLSSEQMKALQEQLRKGTGALGSMQGLPPMSEDPALQMLTAGSGEGEGMPFGRGGVDEGGGEVPLFFGDTEDNLRTANIEKVTNQDFSRASPGEVLGLGETEREIDESPSGLQAAGAILSTGQGGAAVSREILRPEEQSVLKRYFKPGGE